MPARDHLLGFPQVLNALEPQPWRVRSTPRRPSIEPSYTDWLDDMLSTGFSKAKKLKDAADTLDRLTKPRAIAADDAPLQGAWHRTPPPTTFKVPLRCGRLYVNSGDPKGFKPVGKNAKESEWEWFGDPRQTQTGRWRSDGNPPDGVQVMFRSRSTKIVYNSGKTGGFSWKDNDARRQHWEWYDVRG